MKISTILAKIKIIVLFILVSVTGIYAQNNPSLGGYIGAGIMNGNFPSLSGFTTSLFANMNSGFDNDLDFRLSFIYIVDFNVMLPSNPNRYTPSLKAFSLKVVTSQDLSSPFYIEEGIGPLALNDRTFSGLNTWDYGITFSVLAGWDFRGSDSSGLKLGVGTEYGLTLTNTYVRYLTLHFQIQYVL